MKKYILLFIATISAVMVIAQPVALIPYPQKVTEGNGNLNVGRGGVVLVNEAGTLADKAKRFLDFTSGLTYTKQESKTATTPVLKFVLSKSTKEEAYGLKVNEQGIEISAGTEKGFLAGAQTLWQLIGIYSTWRIPYVQIEDAPRYSWRGLHLDVCRHFFPVIEIKKMLRAMSFYKLNTFHWHLTEDQGWRIEIKKYPLLTTIGSERKETVIGNLRVKPALYDGKPYKGYYTQEEIKDVVAFADSLNITIVPEIELPGHAQAAISAYPYLGCTKKPVEVWTNWGISPNIFEPSDTVFAFLEDVMDEVLALFPSKIIHIGGDEAIKDYWKNSAYVQQKIKTLKLKDEHELQNWFITKMEKYLNSKGRNIIGWDEILEGGLAPNAAIMSWRGESGGIKAARLKHNVVMTPGKYCYFDSYQDVPEKEPLAIGGYLPLDQVYSYNPTPDTLTFDERKYILGAQGNLWSEYIDSGDKLEYMAFPRALAMAEICWTKPENKNYRHFLQRVKVSQKWLQNAGINYCRNGLN